MRPNTVCVAYCLVQEVLIIAKIKRIYIFFLLCAQQMLSQGNREFRIENIEKPANQSSFFCSRFPLLLKYNMASGQVFHNFIVDMLIYFHFIFSDLFNKIMAFCLIQDFANSFSGCFNNQIYIISKINILSIMRITFSSQKYDDQNPSASNPEPLLSRIKLAGLSLNAMLSI